MLYILYEHAVSCTSYSELGHSSNRQNNVNIAYINLKEVKYISNMRYINNVLKLPIIRDIVYNTV